MAWDCLNGRGSVRIWERACGTHPLVGAGLAQLPLGSQRLAAVGLQSGQEPCKDFSL
jgi:hypothetical protein